jgi:hypothetical protein
MTIVQGRSADRPQGPAVRRRVGVWTGIAVALWGGLNLAVGVVAALPVGYGIGLITYLRHDPAFARHDYAPAVAGIPSFPIDGDETEIVGAGALFALVIVLAFFGAVNVGLRAALRRWPAWVYWPATVLLLVLPSLVVWL